MNTGRSICARLIDHLPTRGFRKRLEQYEGNRRVRSLPYRDQLLRLVFAQLTRGEMSRYIVACLRAMDGR